MKLKFFSRYTVLSAHVIVENLNWSHLFKVVKLLWKKTSWNQSISSNIRTVIGWSIGFSSTGKCFKGIYLITIFYLKWIDDQFFITIRLIFDLENNLCRFAEIWFGTYFYADFLLFLGNSGYIKLIHPSQLVMYTTMEGHHDYVSCLLFHPTEPTYLFSKCNCRTIFQ